MGTVITLSTAEIQTFKKKLSFLPFGFAEVPRTLLTGVGDWTRAPWAARTSAQVQRGPRKTRAHSEDRL